MTKLLKSIRGYVRIRVNGFAAQRFMNLCGNRGILLWEIVKCGDDYCMNLYLKSFWTIRPIAKKTGAKVAVLERYGLPFFLPKMWKRKGYMIGMGLTFLFWIGSMFFIWDIEIYGNYRITGDMFEDFLEENQMEIFFSTLNQTAFLFSLINLLYKLFVILFKAIYTALITLKILLLSIIIPFDILTNIFIYIHNIIIQF